MKTLLEESAHVMREAIEEQIIDTVLGPFAVESIPLEMFAWVRKGSAIEPQNQNSFELQQHPKSRRYQESVYPPATQPTTTDFWAVELARIVVPKGQIGFLTSLEQVLNDADGNYYPSNVSFWGSPTFVISDVDNCRWYLTLDYYNGLLPNRFSLSSMSPISVSALPGSPYQDLHEIPGLWYPAHNSSNKMSLIIPGQRMLRFFFVTPPTTTYQWQATGRLRAYTQSTYSREAIENARMLY